LQRHWLDEAHSSSLFALGLYHPSFSPSSAKTISGFPWFYPTYRGADPLDFCPAGFAPLLRWRTDRTAGKLTITTNPLCFKKFSGCPSPHAFPGLPNRVCYSLSPPSRPSAPPILSARFSAPEDSPSPKAKLLSPLSPPLPYTLGNGRFRLFRAILGHALTLLASLRWSLILTGAASIGQRWAFSRQPPSLVLYFYSHLWRPLSSWLFIFLCVTPSLSPVQFSVVTSTYSYPNATAVTVSLSFSLSRKSPYAACGTLTFPEAFCFFSYFRLCAYRFFLPFFVPL